MDPASLLARDPSLGGRIPWLPLGRFPTPVQRLEKLGAALGGAQLWIKRDDGSGRPVGGNKVRALEYLLADALAQGRRTLFLIAPMGSNHALATAVYARSLGLRVVAVLFPRPWSEHVRRNLEQTQALGAELHFVPSYSVLPFVTWRHYRRVVQTEGRRPYLMPPGGSSPLSALGHVRAALELAAQVHAGELPEPDALFVALGSGGTMAGLELGVRLAGLKTKVIGVRVTDRWLANEWTVAWLADRAWGVLTSTKESVIQPREITIRHDCCGSGYGVETEDGRQAVAWMGELEGIELEGTYTGKALAGLIRTVRDPLWRDRVALFWNTYGSRFPKQDA